MHLPLVLPKGKSMGGAARWAATAAVPGEGVPMRRCTGRRATIAHVTTRLPGGGVPLLAPLATADGVRLRAMHLPPGPRATASVAVVLAHGFGCSIDKPFVNRIVRRLSDFAGVVAFDFRGHGGSTGRSTLGHAEVLDVDAAVRAARGLGYEQVVTLGFSMGGASVLRHAGLLGVRTEHRVDGVVSVSAASRWHRRDTAALRRLHWLAVNPMGRRVTRRVLRTRVADRWETEPTPPAALVARIAPVPLLLVHGDRDRYLGVDNATDLYDRAQEPRELWLLPGFGHAELALTPELTDRLGAHLAVLLGRKAGSTSAAAASTADKSMA